MTEDWSIILRAGASLGTSG